MEVGLINLYKGTAKSFSEDIRNKNEENGKRILVEILIETFKNKFRREPSEGEIKSWENSLKEISKVFDDIGLENHGVFLEFQLPLSSKRIDCIVIGQNSDGISEVVIIELKQWQRVNKSNLDEAVLTKLEGVNQLLLHPSIQVRNYINYLKDATDIFSVGSKVNISACVYLHNYRIKKDGAILDSKFEKVIEQYPLFGKNDIDGIEKFLKERVAYGCNEESIKLVSNIKFRTSKKINESLINIINKKLEYILLDEQEIVYKTIIKAVESKNDGKNILIINGGPGTGKSVIAINILAYFLNNKSKVNYVTGSKWFTKNLRSILQGTGGEYYFKYFNQYGVVNNNEMDLLICDESHRIRGEKNSETGLYQIEELIRASKTIVFFIDNNQHIRSNEVGSSEYIKRFAKKYEMNNKCKVKVWETKLETQFRCGGMNGFISWIDNTLGIEDTCNILWKEKNENFDFKICSSPKELESLVKEKARQNFTTRIVSGFCWPWTEKGNKDGTLVNDIKIDDYERPWNPSDRANYKVKENKDIPKPECWVNDPKGINQIGCIYTVQGFEFDYVGVIFGNDFVYDGGWKINRDNSKDPLFKNSSDKEFLKSVKNVYRVLLSRGVKGCYVYFLDKNTERFFKSRME